MAEASNPSSSTNLHTTLVDDDLNTTLHYSAAAGKDEDFPQNLTGTQKLDIENYLGWTPLMMACRRGRVSTVKLLLDRGADASRTNNFGLSVFAISIAGGNLEIVKIILEHLLAGGISKNIMQRALSPLSLSILFKKHDILEFLIQHKFDLNAATPLTGVTPLMFASAMEDNHASSLLLKHKAEESIKNHLGETANDIKNMRCQKKEKPKPKPIKLTPAEMISRSPHMAPNRLLSPAPSLLNLNPSHLLCLRKSSNSASPQYFLASPQCTPIAIMGSRPGQVFFAQDFSPMVAGGQQYFSNDNSFLNVNVNFDQTQPFWPNM